MRLDGIVAFVLASCLTVLGGRVLLASSSPGPDDDPTTGMPQPSPSPSPLPTYYGRWPTEWPAERPAYLGPEVPWPPPVPDPRIPVPPECRRLEAMDSLLLDMVRSPDPAGFATFVNAPGSTRPITRIRLRDNAVEVAIHLQADAGDLVEQYGVRLPYRIPPRDYLPSGGISGFVPLDKLCALANDSRIRRLALPNYGIDF